MRACADVTFDPAAAAARAEANAASNVGDEPSCFTAILARCCGKEMRTIGSGGGGGAVTKPDALHTSASAPHVATLSACSSLYLSHSVPLHSRSGLDHPARRDAIVHATLGKGEEGSRGEG